MNDLPKDEKLLTGTESEKFLPTLSAKDFLKSTPEHELKNVFGIPHNESLAKKDGLFGSSLFAGKKSSVPSTPSIELPKKIKPLFSFFRLLTSLLSLVLIIITVLYIYGAILAL